MKGSIIWGNTTHGGTPNDVDACDEQGATYNSLAYHLLGAAGSNLDLALEINRATRPTSSPPGSVRPRTTAAPL